MAKHHELKLTPTSFTVRGLITGLDKDFFYSETPQRKDPNKKTKTMNFSIKTSEENVVNHIQLKDFQKDDVRYSYLDGEEYKMCLVPWKDRYDKNTIKACANGHEDAKLSFGKRISLDLPKEGEKQTTRVLTCFDTIDLINKMKNDGNINENTTLYINGEISPWSFTNKETGEVQRGINLTPNFIMRNETVPFEKMSEETLKANSKFSMGVIVKDFYEINGTTYMRAIIVKYDIIHEMEFKFVDEQIADTFKNNLDPYTYIEIAGSIGLERQQDVVVVEEPKEDYAWVAKGFEKQMEVNRNTGYGKLTFTIFGARKQSIDTETYSEESVEKAKASIKAWQDDYQKGQSATRNTQIPDFGEDKFNDFAAGLEDDFA